MLARAEANGVFQFESSGMRDALRTVKPTEFEDLIALVALYRPGPMAYIPAYAARKNGREAVTYIDARLKPITGDSYGICIYQEQYMQIAKQLAGFEPAEAETLRRAIGKKIHELMASLKDKFLTGCAANDVTPAVATQLWKDMEQSQDYSFNKAHAACYALIAYRTAWLKANHPCEYMAALISSVMNTKDRVPLYVNACHEMGIDVLPPDVNTSQTDFAVVEGKIRFGLNAVKNVGETAARAIIRARDEGGPFESIWDFTERVDPQVVNKRALESLVKCGALDSTGASRMGMLAAARAGARVRAEVRSRPARRPGLDLRPRRRRRDGERPKHHPAIPAGEFEKPELLRLEKETLGLYVSEHPLHAVRDQLRRKTDATLAELERRRDGETVTVGGIVSAVKQLTTKKGEPMVFLTLDDPTGGGEVVVFNSTYANARDLCVADRILVVKGRIDHKQQGETKLIALEVAAFEAVAVRREVRFKLDARAAPRRDHPRARRAREGVSGRVARLRLARDLARPEDARARPAAPRRDRLGLPHRRPPAARRRSAAVASGRLRRLRRADGLCRDGHRLAGAEGRHRDDADRRPGRGARRVGGDEDGPLLLGGRGRDLCSASEQHLAGRAGGGRRGEDVARGVGCGGRGAGHALRGRRACWPRWACSPRCAGGSRCAGRAGRACRSGCARWACRSRCACCGLPVPLRLPVRPVLLRLPVLPALLTRSRLLGPPVLPAQLRRLRLPVQQAPQGRPLRRVRSRRSGRRLQPVPQVRDLLVLLVLLGLLALPGRPARALAALRPGRSGRSGRAGCTGGTARSGCATLADRASFAPRPWRAGPIPRRAALDVPLAALVRPHQPHPVGEQVVTGGEHARGGRNPGETGATVVARGLCPACDRGGTEEHDDPASRDQHRYESSRSRVASHPACPSSVCWPGVRSRGRP